MICLKGPGRRAPRDGLHHGRLHLQEVLMNKEIPDGLNNPVPQNKDFSYLVVYDEVQVTLSVSGFFIGQPMPFFRKGSHRLGEQSDTISKEGQLPGLGSKKAPLNTDEITHIHVPKDLILLLTHFILSDICLDATGPVLQVNKGGLSETTDGHYPPCHGKRLFFLFQGLFIHLAIAFFGLGGRHIALKSCRIQTNALVPEGVCFLPSLLNEWASFFHDNLVSRGKLFLEKIRHYLIICIS